MTQLEYINYLKRKLDATGVTYRNLDRYDDDAQQYEQQKIEIERLTEETGRISQSYIEVCDINAELQKQVDDLKNRKIEPLIVQCHTPALETCPKVQQAIKDTSKEILQLVGDIVDDGDDRFKYKDYQWHKKLCERYGVEVE